MTNKTNADIKTYVTWTDIRQRCNNKNNPSYANYGGRGIKIDPRWDVYNNFLQDMGEAPVGHSIERKDNNGDYTKENCKWATAKEQGRNRRTTILTENIVRLIKATIKSRGHEMSRRSLYAELGNAFGVTADCIRSIERGKNWREV